MSFRDKVLSVVGETMKKEQEATLKGRSDSKFGLIVRVNLWRSRDIHGVVVHPAHKSDDVHFKNADELIGLLEEWNANNLAWDHPSNMQKNNQGLTFSVRLEPWTENHPRKLSGIITNADNQERSESFSNASDLISTINKWNIEKLNSFKKR
jgi:hypothetical protein